MSGSAALNRGQVIWQPPASPQASRVTVAPVTSHSDWLDQCIRRVEELKQLRPNWDGYASPPITTDALSSAALLLRAAGRHTLPIPRVAPVSGGGLVLEWRVALRSVEFEVLPNGRVEYLCVERRPPEPDLCEEGELSIARVYEAHYPIEWLLGLH